ncbi:glycogen synthase-domain-containing protein [Lactarius hengduanensis]|nr:glycogen synthase-domain-containing protein [Lactarius hengduanensis]
MSSLKTSSTSIFPLFHGSGAPGFHTAIVAHSHEWRAGVAIPLCRRRRINVATVFTTHATPGPIPLHWAQSTSTTIFNTSTPTTKRRKRGIHHRYCIDPSAAHSTDVFTTVPHITAYEAESH